VENAEHWSGRMVSVEQVGTEVCLVARFQRESVVVNRVSSSRNDDVRSLYEQAKALRKLITAALQSYAQHPATASDEVAASPAFTPPESHMGRQNCEATLKAPPATANRNPRGLVGLPCPECGSCYDSKFPACPYCHPNSREEANAGAYTDPALMERERPTSQEARNNRANGDSNFTIAVMRSCIDELLDAGARYAGRLALAQDALGVTPDEAGKIMYELVFPRESLEEPWEACAASFRHGYAIRAAALLAELRRRAGLDGNPYQPKPLLLRESAESTLARPATLGR